MYKVKRKKTREKKCYWFRSATDPTQKLRLKQITDGKEPNFVHIGCIMSKMVEKATIFFTFRCFIKRWPKKKKKKKRIPANQPNFSEISLQGNKTILYIYI